MAPRSILWRSALLLILALAVLWGAIGLWEVLFPPECAWSFGYWGTYSCHGPSAILGATYLASILFIEFFLLFAGGEWAVEVV